MNKIQQLGLKVGMVGAAISSAILPFLAKADLSADMTDIASTVGVSFREGAVDILTAALPYLIPVVLLLAGFYFVWRKARGAIK